jgi:hypothetical protein
METKGEESMSNKTPAPVSSIQRLSLEKPILTCLVLLAIAFFFKWVDTFVLRLDERLGEIILCKTLGFVPVILFVWAAGEACGILACIPGNSARACSSELSSQ